MTGEAIDPIEDDGRIQDGGLTAEAVAAIGGVLTAELRASFMDAELGLIASGLTGEATAALITDQVVQRRAGLEALTQKFQVGPAEGSAQNPSHDGQ